MNKTIGRHPLMGWLSVWAFASLLMACGGGGTQPLGTAQQASATAPPADLALSQEGMMQMATALAAAIWHGVEAADLGQDLLPADVPARARPLRFPMAGEPTAPSPASTDPQIEFKHGVAVTAPYPCTFGGTVVAESFQDARRPTAVGDHFLWTFRRCSEQSEHLLDGAIRLSVGGLEPAQDKRLARLDVQLELASFSHGLSLGGATPIQQGNVFLTVRALTPTQYELEADIRTDLEWRLPGGATRVQLTGLTIHQNVEAAAHDAMPRVLTVGGGIRHHAGLETTGLVKTRQAFRFTGPGRFPSSGIMEIDCADRGVIRYTALPDGQRLRIELDLYRTGFTGNGVEREWTQIF